MDLPSNFHDLPLQLRVDIIDRIVNPPIFLPQYWVLWDTPIVGLYKDVEAPCWSSYIVLPWPKPEDWAVEDVEGYN